MWNFLTLHPISGVLLTVLGYLAVTKVCNTFLALAGPKAQPVPAQETAPVQVQTPKAHQKKSNLASVPTGKLGDLHGALISLGYKAQEFTDKVADYDMNLPIETLLKQAITALSKKVAA